MSRNRNAVSSRLLGLENYMTANLMDYHVSPMPLKSFNLISSTEVARKPHLMTSVSSRTK